MPAQTDLTYNLVAERLTGQLDGYRVDAHAVSGGRAGSKMPGAVNVLLANNPFATGVRLTATNPGGPIPLASFRLKAHESRPNWIRLLPLPGQSLNNRDGFAIHGRGQRGSDGCIVPTDFAVVQRLLALTLAREQGGLPSPTLLVVAQGDFGRFERLTHLA